MPETKENTKAPIKGELTFEDKVIQKIVGHAIEEVTGLLGVDGGFITNIKNKLVNAENATDGISVEVGKTQVAVDLNLIMEYGHNAHDIYEQIAAVVEQHLSKTTNLDLVELNVRIVDIQSQEEFSDGQVTLQDKLSDASDSIKGKLNSEDTTKAPKTNNNRVK